MNKKTLTGLLSVLCVLLCSLVIFCACTGDNTPADTTATEAPTEAPATETVPETNEETDPEATETATDGKVTYTIIVVDADGNPVANVDVQMCAADGTCFLPVKTNDAGVATFEKETGTYYVTIPAAPEGFAADTETKHNFAEGTTELTITLEKAAEATEAPTEEPTEEPTEAPTEPEKYPAWDADKSVVNHQSFDQLYTGTGSADEATNGGLDLFAPGKSAEWDFIADLTNSDATVLTYWGWIGVKGAVGQFGYMIDDNTPIYNDEWTHATEQPVIDAAIGGGADTGSRMKIAIDLAGLIGEHTVRVLYKSADGVEITLGLFTVKLALPEIYYVSNSTSDILQIISTNLVPSDYIYTPGTYDEWTEKSFTLKVGQTGGFWDLGFVALNTDVYEFGYLFGGVSPLNNGAYFFPGPAYTAMVTGDQLATAQELGYSTAGAFQCMCAEAALGVGENTVQVVIRLNGDDNQIYVLREYTVILEA